MNKSTGDQSAREQQFDTAIDGCLVLLSSVGVNLTEEDIRCIKHVLMMLVRR